MAVMRAEHSELPWNPSNARMPIKEPITLADFWDARVEGKLAVIGLVVIDRALQRYSRDSSSSPRLRAIAEWLCPKVASLLVGTSKRKKGSHALMQLIAKTLIRVLFRRSKLKYDLLGLCMRLPPNHELLVEFIEAQDEKQDPMDYQFRPFVLTLLIFLFCLREKLLNPTITYRPDRGRDRLAEPWRQLRLRQVTTNGDTKTELEPEALEDWWAVGEALVLESWGSWERLLLPEVKVVLGYDASNAQAMIDGKPGSITKAFYRVRERAKAAFILMAELLVADRLLGSLFKRADFPESLLAELEKSGEAVPWVKNLQVATGANPTSAEPKKLIGKPH